jgi:exonuclease-1
VLNYSPTFKPIAVFDGRHLPSKAETERKRAKDRAESRKKAADCFRNGNTAEARKFAMRAVDVTSAMAREVIDAVRKMKIRYVVAPYEADAQLAFLNLAGIAEAIVTEDSDLIVFGCKKVLFKLDSAGMGMLYDKEKLGACFKVRERLTEL